MSTVTAKLELRQPERGADGAPDDLINVAADVNENMNKIDQMIHCEIVTSAARPSNPFQGQFIFETDTKYVSMWSGTSWIVVGADKFAKGRIGILSSTTNVPLTGGTETGPHHSITFTASSNRRYVVEWHFYLIGVPQVNNAIFRWAAGPSVTTTGTQIGENQLCSLHNSGASVAEHYTSLVQIEPGILLDGEVTIGAFIATGTNGIELTGNFSTSKYPRDFLVRDVGI